MKKLSLKKIAALFACAAVMVSAAGCGNNTSTTASTGADTDAAEAPAVTAAPAASGTVLNFTPPEVGEKIAVIEVKDYGTIKIKLFPEAAPKAVENFVGLAEMNYYDELIFHRIIPNFMNQGGAPRGNGTGGSSVWGGSFDGGIPEGLYHFSGAIAYANSGSTATNGSQFYIVNTPEGYMQNTPEELMAYNPEQYKYSQEAIDLYNEKGGTPFLDGGYTVFGQVFEGMDVVRAMAEVETDANDKPTTQVMMTSVRIVEYDGN